MLAIGLMPDHIHSFIGYNVNQMIPDWVEQIKISSNAGIREKQVSKYKFDWQKGYGAFTHSRSQLDTVGQYILKQEAPHKKKTFREEHIDMLAKSEVAYKEAYLFDSF